MTLATARAGAITALIFLGVSSFIGAVPMLIDPNGTPLHMPRSLLRYSPFDSFLIPGVLLLVANGLLSFVVLGTVLRKQGMYGWWVIGQGLVLAGWLLIEIAILRGANWAHAVYGLVAASLLITGWALRGAREPAAL